MGIEWMGIEEIVWGFIGEICWDSGIFWERGEIEGESIEGVSLLNEGEEREREGEWREGEREGERGGGNIGDW